MQTRKQATLSLAIDASQARAGAQQFTGATNQVTTATKGATAALAALSKAFGGLYIAYKAISIVKESVREFAVFERQMANVSTMLNDQSMKHLPQYGRQIRTLSIAMGEGTATLSKGLYDILSASIPAADAMDVLTISSRAAQAGLSDTGTAADALTTILNSYGLSAEYAGKVSSDMFETVQRGKLTFGELASSIGNVASDAATAGVSLEELLGTISTMTRAGLKSEIAITSLRGIIDSLRNPSDDAKAAFASLGIEIEKGVVQAGGLVGIFKALAQANPAVLNAIIADRRAASGLNTVFQQLEGHAEDVAFIMRTSGADVEAFGKMSDPAAKKFEQYDQAIRSIKVSIGEAFAPALAEGATKLAQFISDNQRHLDRWASDWQEGAEFTAGVVSDLFEVLSAVPDAFLEKMNQVRNALDILPSSARMPIVDPTDPLGSSARGGYGSADQLIRDAAAGSIGPVDFGPLMSASERTSSKRKKPSFTSPSVETGMPTLSRAGREFGTDGASAYTGPGAQFPDPEDIERYWSTSIDYMNQDIKKRKDVIVEMDRMEKSVERELDLIGRLPDSYERAAAAMEYAQRANELYGEGSEEAQRKIAAFDKSLERLERNKKLVDVAQDIGDSFGRVFTDLIAGAATAEEAFVSLGSAIVNALVQAMIIQPLVQGITGGMMGVPTMHSGGIVGQTASPSRYVDPGMFAMAPRLHSGLKSDEFPAILQRGEAVIPKGQSPESNAAAPNVSFNITNQSSSQVETQQTGVQFDGRRMIVGMVLKDKRNNGPVSRSQKRR
jgi:TP901 family phage tail tape measure protein